MNISKIYTITQVNRFTFLWLQPNFMLSRISFANIVSHIKACWKSALIVGEIRYIIDDDFKTTQDGTFLYVRWCIIGFVASISTNASRQSWASRFSCTDGDGMGISSWNDIFITLWIRWWHAIIQFFLKPHNPSPRYRRTNIPRQSRYQTDYHHESWREKNQSKSN